MSRVYSIGTFREIERKKQIKKTKSIIAGIYVGFIISFILYGLFKLIQHQDESIYNYAKSAEQCYAYQDAIEKLQFSTGDKLVIKKLNILYEKFNENHCDEILPPPSRASIN